MDAVAVGLIMLVLGGILYWIERGRQLLPGAISLLMGLLACGFFCFGLRWFF
jgi:hypothetical protein